MAKEEFILSGVLKHVVRLHYSPVLVTVKKPSLVILSQGA
jgi:hypothetical protein